MTLSLFSNVRLTTDRYAERGVGIGSGGTIVLVHDSAYEVEFSRPDGSTIAWFAVRPEELELVADEPDAREVRRVG